jgi:hypothetical protein
MIPRKKRIRYKANAIQIAKENNLILNAENWEEVWSILDKYAQPDYLYAIVDKQNLLVKFGKSVNPGHRLKQLKTANGMDLKIWAFCRNMPPLTENEIHKRLAHINVSGEWFNLKDEAFLVIEEMRFAAGV